MAQVVSETEPELPPVQKYMQAMAVCNSLALLASQNAMLVFVQRLALLKKLQSCWTKGHEAQIIVPDGFEPDLEGEVVGIDGANDTVDVKLEPDFARVVGQQQLPQTLALENGESSDETIVDEQLACSVVSCDDVDALKAELETVVEEEKPAVRKTTTLRVGLRRKAKAPEKEEAADVPKRKRGRPAKPKKTAETKEPVEKRRRSDAKEEAVEDPESSTFNFLCIVCKEAFTTFVQLKEHKADAHGLNSESEQTTTTVVSRRSKRSSQSSRQKKRSVCTVCSRSYENFYKLKIHMFSHTGERPHLCNICGRSFAKKEIFNVHMRVHTGEKPYKCSECDARFGQFTDLAYHQRARHTGEKPCVCTECGRQFRKSTLLMYHMRTHTGEKPFECPCCERKFARPSQLAQHKKMHSDIKAYLCPDCGKTFRTHNNLNRHKRIHLIVKPYSCSECTKAFTQLYNLKTHMRTHTGQKPYACEKCGKQFAYQGTLKKHADVHLE